MDEIEVLVSIYMDELHVNYNDTNDVSSIEMVIHPATAENTDEQYVCATLILELPQDYPNSSPKITIRNPRGLSDKQISKLDSSLKNLSKTKTGEPILFELIEATKDYLTKENVPFGECSICLCEFHMSDKFLKTECYHHFHHYCLARYIRHMLKVYEDLKKEVALERGRLDVQQEDENLVVCPVCRLPFTYDLRQLSAAPEPHHDQDDLQVDTLSTERRRQMADIYQKQLAVGGIIDVERERNKFLISGTAAPQGATDTFTDTSHAMSSLTISSDDFHNGGCGGGGGGGGRGVTPHRGGRGAGGHRRHYDTKQDTRGHPRGGRRGRGGPRGRRPPRHTSYKSAVS